jgi:hypothetical protein
MLSIMHQAYQYCPKTDEQRAKLAAGQRVRLGIPPWGSRLYGTIFKTEVADILRRMLCEISRLDGRQKAEQTAQSLQNVTAKEAKNNVDDFFCKRILLAQTLRGFQPSPSRSWSPEWAEYCKAQRELKEKAKAAIEQTKKLVLQKQLMDQQTKEAREMQDAMLLFDEGLPVDEISKALHLPRTKILEQIRATKRRS